MADLNLRVSADPSELKKDIETMTTVTEKGAGKMGASVDNLSFKQEALNKQFDLSVQKAATLAARHGQTSTEALKAAAAAESLALKLKQAQAATSTNVNAVRSASSGYNGLQNSVNQITREMPAFTFSMQTGFMAISNNLPIFFDQISAMKAANKELAASGQATKSIGSQVASSLLSWGTAMSLGITALTVFGPQLISYIGQLDEAAEATKRLTDATKMLADEERKINDIVKESTRLRISAMQDGIEKEKSLALQSYKDGLKELTTAHMNNEVADITYLSRKNSLWQIYQNELSAINKREQERRNSDAVKAFNEDLAREKWVIDELAKIRKKQVGLGGLSIGKTPELKAATRLDLQLDIGQATQSGKTQIAMMYEDFMEGIKAGNQSLEQLIQGMGKSLKDAAVSTFANVGQAVGQGIAAGFDGSGFDSFAKMMGQTLANLANQIGLSLIAFGTPLLFVPGTQLQGLAYVAGGTAMIAAGSFISAKMGSGGASGGGSTGGGSMSGGTSSGWSGTGGFNTGFGSMQAMAITGGAKITGRDLQLVYGREGYFSRRVTGK